MSFLAFFGVLVVAPAVIKRIYGEREPGLIKAIIIESLAAEVATLPYALWIFGEFSLIGILGNVLVVAFIPLAMLLTLCAGLAGLIIPFLAGWIAWPASMLLTYMLDVAHLLSKAPHAFMSGIEFSTVYMIGSYLIICIIVVILHYKSKRKYAIITDSTQARNLEGV